MSSQVDRAARHSKELLHSLLSKGSSSSSRSSSNSTRSPHFPPPDAPSSSSASSSSASASSAIAALPRLVGLANKAAKKRPLDEDDDGSDSESDEDEDDVKWETPQEATKSADRDAALKRVLSESSASKSSSSSSSAPSVTVSINRSASAMAFNKAKAGDDDANSESSRKRGFGFGAGKKRPKLYNREDCCGRGKKNSKPKRPGVTKKDRELALQVHQFQLLAFLARIKARSRLLDSELIQSVMYSRLSEKIHSLGSKDITRADLADLVAFFRSSFHACHDDVEFRLSCGQNLLMMCGEQQLIDVANGDAKGGREHWCMLFVAACRALGVAARMITAVWPSSLKPALSKSTPIILDWSIPRCYCGYKPPDPKPTVVPSSSSSSKKASHKKRKLTRRSAPATTPRSSSSSASSAAAQPKTSPYFRFGFGSESKAKKSAKSAGAPKASEGRSADSLKISSDGSIDLTSSSSASSSAPYPKKTSGSFSGKGTASSRAKAAPKSVPAKRKASAAKVKEEKVVCAASDASSALPGRRSARIAKLVSPSATVKEEAGTEKSYASSVKAKKRRLASDRIENGVEAEAEDSVPEPAALPPTAAASSVKSAEPVKTPSVGVQRRRLTRKRRKSAQRPSAELGDTQARTKQKARRRLSHDSLPLNSMRVARGTDRSSRDIPSPDSSETESPDIPTSLDSSGGRGLQARTKQKRRVSTKNEKKSQSKRTPAKANANSSAKTATKKKSRKAKSAPRDADEGEEYVLPDEEGEESEGEEYNEDIEEEDDEAYEQEDEEEDEEVDETPTKKRRAGRSTPSSSGGKKRSRSEVYARVEAKLNGKTPKKGSAGKRSSPKSSSSSKKRAPGFWVEVFCPEARKWLHVDCISGAIDNPKAYASSTPPIVYAIAAGTHGRLKDVTKRYSDRWSETAKLRAPDVWMNTVFHACNEGLEPDELMAKDDGELESFALSEPMPKSLQAFNNHPLYCIEKFVKKYETIYPKYPVLGEIRGFSVYPAANLYTLHSSDLWFKEARVVKAGEIPVKTVKASPFSSNQDDVGLFGVWQTEEWTSPPVVNGKVPKNDRGQVDLLSDKHMPPGATHLPIPRLSLTAKRLGVDYAPAMIGFEIRKRRSVPVFKGIVVASEHAEMLVEAHHQAERQRVEKAEAKRLKGVLKRWERLVKGALARHDVLTDDLGAKKFEAANSKIKAAAAKSKIKAAAAAKKKSAAAAAAKKKSAAASAKKTKSATGASAKKTTTRRKKSPTSSSSADAPQGSRTTRKSTRRRSARAKKVKEEDSDESDSNMKDEDDEKDDGDWDGGANANGSDGEDEDEEYVSDGEADVLKDEARDGDDEDEGEEDVKHEQGEDEEFEM